MNMPTTEERLRQVELEKAVLKERVKRLESIVYGVIAFASLQLVGLFIMWAFQIFKMK